MTDIEDIEIEAPDCGDVDFRNEFATAATSCNVPVSEVQTCFLDFVGRYEELASTITCDTSLDEALPLLSPDTCANIRQNCPVVAKLLADLEIERENNQNNQQDE